MFCITPDELADLTDSFHTTQILEEIFSAYGTDLGSDLDTENVDDLLMGFGVGGAPGSSSSSSSDDDDQGQPGAGVLNAKKKPIIMRRGFCL